MMTPENAMIAMVVLVGLYCLFLVAVRLEVRRSLQSLARKRSRIKDAKVFEANYQTVMARLDARKRLAQIRYNARHQADHNGYSHNGHNHNGYNGYQLNLVEGGTRIPATRERRQLG